MTRAPWKHGLKQTSYHLQPFAKKRSYDYTMDKYWADDAILDINLIRASSVIHVPRMWNALIKYRNICAVN
ncbi:hypothetical protein N7447_000560 [Penicillium robsamsonii]|uniref:uncharacterized protein n=1 Tax=Penicillium robsamsonii TaxID=1792511 RepID=UPI002548C98F|nr:uncharacterized protein N7447_000560 [Penicillium robsamsonii]KAJ5834534.1 hypothetical protein N7447_000560 [Penicillium robsamsonii]